MMSPTIGSVLLLNVSGSDNTERTAGPVAVGTIGSITSAPPPLRNTGISIRFQGSEYFSAGRTVPYTPKQFERIGDHHGFPVFRDQQGDTETIYVTVVADGPLARYRRKD